MVLACQAPVDAVTLTPKMAFDPQPGRDDSDLLAAYAAGDQAAARALTARVAPGLMRLARRMLRDEAEAEDVVQEAMLKLWKIAPKWEPGRAKLSTWAYTVTTNLCTDRLRKSQRMSGDEVPEQADDAKPVDRRLIEEDRASALDAALSGLPDRQRAAITLRHMEECSNPEIAEIMGLSVEAVESLLSRGRRALKAALEPKRDALGLDGVQP